MSRDTLIESVNKLSKTLNKSIPISKFVRRKIIQEEIVDAYISPVPSAVPYKIEAKDKVTGKMVTVLKSKQVETGNWVVIHADGSQETYTPLEFSKIFEVVQEKKRERVNV